MLTAPAPLMGRSTWSGPWTVQGHSRTRVDMTAKYSHGVEAYRERKSLCREKVRIILLLTFQSLKFPVGRDRTGIQMYEV